MNNNENNNINNNFDSNEETISVEERNIFQDEFYPVNYEIQNSSNLNENSIQSATELSHDISDNTNLNYNNINNHVIEEIVDTAEIANAKENELINENFIEKNEYSNEIEAETTTNNILSSTANEDGKYKKTNIIFYFIIGIVIGLIILFVIMFMNSNKTKIVNCSYSKEDDVYTESEEYTITYTKNIISYIEGVYSYKTIPENSKQINVIKEQKIPVIVNSNGIDGFTHMFEIGETSFKIYSYYDYDIMNFEIIDKNDSNKTPISYINIDSSKSFKKMKKDLENIGFKCINSK